MNPSTSDERGRVALDDILATDELGRRVPRPGNYRVEAQVMAILAQTLADRPEDILQVLVRTAVELCGEGTCGISLLERANDEAVFRWIALAGVCEKYAGGCTPRDHSPCGVTLDRGAPQLFSSPGRYFTYLADVQPAIVEGLVIPFYHGDEAFGTIWIVSHDPVRRFDEEDVRIMTRLGAFTSAGLKTVRSLKAANKAREDLAFLADLRARLSVTLDGDAGRQAALAATGEHFLADRCCLIQAEEVTQTFKVQQDWHATEMMPFNGSHQMTAFGSPPLWTAMTTEGLALRDVRRHPWTLESRKAFEQQDLISFASVPCSTAHETAPLLWVGTRRPRAWTTDELNVLQAAAALVFAFSSPTPRC